MSSPVRSKVVGMANSSASGYFRRYSGEIRSALPTEDSIGRGRGLRRTQVAVALAAAGAVGEGRRLVSFSMPAGTGSYAVLTLLPFLVSANRVLVSAPNALIRDNIASEFRSLSSLRHAGACSDDVPSPGVGVAMPADRQSMAAVTDATVGQVAHLIKLDIGTSFDLVLVLAGHAWRAVGNRLLERLPPDASIVVLTSGPPASLRPTAAIVASYSLGQALRDGVIAPVDLRLVDSSRDGVDRAIASEASLRLRSDTHSAGGSMLLVRSPAVHQERLLHIYSEFGVRLAPVSPPGGEGSLRMALRQVSEREKDGLFVSSSLGEGLPDRRAAIAAYHRDHGLLAETAHILGRTTAIERVQGELIASAADIESETGSLYGEDPGWLDLLPGLTDAVAGDRSEARKFIAEFAPPTLPGVSLGAVRVPKNVCVFRVRSANLEARGLATPFDMLARGVVVYDAVHPDGRMRIVITEHQYSPPWLMSRSLDSLQHELHVVVWSDNHQLLFIASSRSETADEIVDKLQCEDAVRVEAGWIDRLMYGLHLHGYFSVGMRNARGGARRRAAYQMLAGPSVGGAVRASDAQTFATGHLIARADDILRGEASRPTSIGCSYAKSRIWSPGYLNVWMFLKWCERLATLVEQVPPDHVPSTAPGLALSSPRYLDVFPAEPYAVVLDAGLYEAGLLVEVDGVQSDLASLLFDAERASDKSLSLAASNGDATLWTGTIDVRGRVVADEDKVLVVTAEGELVSIAELLDGNPPTVFFADGSCVTGHSWFQPSDELPALDDRTLSEWTFDNVQITAESKKATEGRLNVQQYTLQQIEAAHPNGWVVVDDGANELADIIAVDLASDNRTVRLTLIHCKYSSKKFTGSRVEDLYVVLGQAQRSTRWLGPHVWRELAKRLAGRASTRLERGRYEELMSKLAEWETVPPRVQYAIHVVQPGQRASEINAHPSARCLISVARDFVSDYEADFQLFARSDDGA
jgi:hypothetical protein